MRTLSNRQGRFTLRDLLAGSTQLTFTRLGYTPSQPRRGRSRGHCPQGRPLRPHTCGRGSCSPPSRPQRRLARRERRRAPSPEGRLLRAGTCSRIRCRRLPRRPRRLLRTTGRLSCEATSSGATASTTATKRDTRLMPCPSGDADGNRAFSAGWRARGRRTRVFKYDVQHGALGSRAQHVESRPVHERTD